MDLGDGLEEIGERDFEGSIHLRRVAIPPSVKVIKDEAFLRCSQLTHVDLGEGLEEIGWGAFY